MSKIVVCSIGLCLKNVTSLDEFSDLLKQEKSIKKEFLEISDDIIKDKLNSYMSEDDLRRIDRVSKILLLSALSCNENLGIDLKKYINDIGIIVNTSFGAINSLKHFIESALTKGDKNASPIIFPFSVPNAATGVITIKLGLRGFNTTTSGYNPVGYAYDDLFKLKRSSAIFAGGFDELNDMLKLIDVEDNVFYSNNISEGSAMVFITTRDFAERNNLNILFEVCGFTCNNDINSEFSIDNSNSINEILVENCVKRIINENPIKFEDIDIIVSPFNQDSKEAKIEKKVLDKIFTNKLLDIKYPKSIIGETFGCSSTIYIIAAYAYLKNKKSSQYGLVNHYEIGGNFSSVIIKNI
jgi:3-oxoacyl-[acyl-carrier-protein] synthase II